MVNNCTVAFAELMTRRSAIVSVQNPVRLGEDSQPPPDVALLRWRDDPDGDSLPGPGEVLLVIEVADSCWPSTAT